MLLRVCRGLNGNVVVKSHGDQWTVVVELIGQISKTSNPSRSYPGRLPPAQVAASDGHTSNAQAQAVTSVLLQPADQWSLTI